MKKYGKILIAIFLALLFLFSPIENAAIQSTLGIESVEAKTIKLNKTKVSLKKGSTYQLKVLGSSKQVKWTSSNSKIVSVSKKGKIKAKKVGKATIVAKIGKKKLKCRVSVKAKEKKHKNKVVYKSNVVQDIGEKQQNYNVSQKTDGTCVVDLNKNNATQDIKTDSIVILPDDQGNPYLALKVNQVREVQGKIEIVGEEPELEEVFDDIDIETETDVPWDDFEYNDSIISNISYTTSANTRDKLYGAKAEGSYSFGDDIILTLKDNNLSTIGDLSGQITISAPTLKTVLDVDIDHKESVINQVKLSLNETVSTNIKFTLSDSFEKEIFLGHITVPIKDGFKADLIFYLKLAANGEVQVCNTTSVSVGIEYADQKMNPIYQPSVSFEGTKAQGEATALMTPQLQIRWLGVWDEEKKDVKWTVRIVRTELDFGVGIAVSADVYDTKPYLCEEIQIYAILKIAMKDNYGLGKTIAGINKKLEHKIPLSWEVLGNNSKNKWRTVWHYEDGVRTKDDKCTRGSKTKQWSEYKYDVFEYDGYLYYAIDNVLYKSPKALYEKNIREEVTRWKIDKKYTKSDYRCHLINGVGNSLYIEYGNFQEFSGQLDVVNIKSGTKKTVLKSFGRCVVDGTVGSKYIYGYPWPISDASAYPISVWKIDKNGIHTVRKLGDRVFGVYKVKNKLYYGVYPPGGLRKVTGYVSNLDGSKPKKLFTLESKGKYDQIYITEANSKKLQIYKYENSGGGGTYEYDLKTKKLKKVK